MNKTTSAVFTVRYAPEKGDKGDGELSVRLTPSTVYIPATSSGIPTESKAYSITAAIYCGAEVQKIEGVNIVPCAGVIAQESMRYKNSTEIVTGINAQAYEDDTAYIDITLRCAKGSATARFNAVCQRQGANGTSIKAQYSADGSTNWHDTFKKEDLWMRIWDGSKWGEAMRIVGEKGEGGAWTDYSFAISSETETDSATTAPSDIVVWSDAPIATTYDKPYLWMRIRKYNGDNVLQGKASYTRLTGVNGKNGKSVSIKGRVDTYEYVFANYPKVDMPIWAIQIGTTYNGQTIPDHCVVQWNELHEKFDIVKPSDGDCYLVNAKNINPDYFEGHLLMSDGTKWGDVGVIQGEKGNDGQTAYVYIAYANSADGTKDFVIESAKDSSKTYDYMGICASYSETQPTTPTSYTWTKTKGDKGDKGDNALYVECVPDSFMYPSDDGVSCIQNTKHTAVIYLKYGFDTLTPDDIEVRTTDYKIWCKISDVNKITGDIYIDKVEITESAEETYTTVVFTIGESNFSGGNAWVEFRFYMLIDGNRYSVTKRINCYANKEGARGYDGVIVRRSEWEAGKEYRNDTDHVTTAADGNYYLDEVCVSNMEGGTSRYYVCKTTHIATTDNKPTLGGTSALWSAMNSQAPIKTPFADIANAIVDYLQAQQIIVTQSDGTPYGAFGGGDYPLWFGGKTPATSKFQVTKDGVLSAMGAILQGTLTEEAVSYAGSQYANLPIIADATRSININDPKLNMVVLPTYNGFKDKSCLAYDGLGESYADRSLSVPAYRQSGTHLTISTTPVEDFAGWAALNESLWPSQENYLPTMLDHCVLVCADPQTLCCEFHSTSVQLIKKPSHIWNGQTLGTGQYVGSTGYAGYAHGRFSYKGAVGRFLILLPGQHLHLISSIEKIRCANGYENCLVWHIENTADFSPISMRMYWDDGKYKEFPSSTSNLSMVNGGIDYTQDMFFAPPILDVNRNNMGYVREMNLSIVLGGLDWQNPVPHLYRGHYF